MEPHLPAVEITSSELILCIGMRAMAFNEDPAPTHEPKGEEGFPPAFLPTDVAEAANYTIQRLKNPIHSIRQSMF
jgi:hypothetical protein